HTPQVRALGAPTVQMRRPGLMHEPLRTLRKAEGGCLQVVSDFDLTLSKFSHGGKRCPSSYNILDNSKVISEECCSSLRTLTTTIPIETDPQRPVEEKMPHMVEWWTRAHELLCGQSISWLQIAEVVREWGTMLREGYKTFFDTLYQHGIGDILEKVIWQRGTLHPNIHILYNYMDLGDDGLLQGFKAPLIHIFNKNSAVGSSANYFRQLQGRTNILLLGDSLGDRSMADGVPGVQDILKVGFLNDKVEQQRERYLEAYDAVLESDEMLDVVNGLLQHILCPGGHEDTPEQVYHGAQAHLPPLPLPPCLLPKTHVGRLVEAFVKKPHFSPIEGHTAVS
uniref:5'-nucleotidase n=1 Tax=Cavia porcellus TaxID=10141 RepID=H0VV35_CAVPO